MDDKRREYLKNYQEQRKRINLSLSLSDYKKVEYLAQKLSLKPTSFVHHIIQEKLGKNPNISPEIQKELREVKYLIRNIANNINQVAHRSNILKAMLDENALLMELKKLEDTIMNYVTTEIKS